MLLIVKTHPHKTRQYMLVISFNKKLIKLDEFLLNCLNPIKEITVSTCLSALHPNLTEFQLDINLLDS